MCGAGGGRLGGGIRAAEKTRTGPQKDTSVIDAQGAAHVTRVVPVPESLSPEAKTWVGKKVPDAACTRDAGTAPQPGYVGGGAGQAMGACIR